MTMLDGMKAFGTLVVTMEQCYSGAFLQPTLDHSKASRTSFASAVPADKVSAGDSHFDQWARTWFEAAFAEPTPAQREVLGAMPYSSNTALLHTDTSLLPKAGGARASWNFLRPVESVGHVTVTYDLTRLQRLDTDTRYLVTLGGEHLVDPATVIDRMEYEHPLYTPASVAAQRRLPAINTDRIAFAGAYHGWGFHEDGARSGLVAVERLGLAWPSRPLQEWVEPGVERTTRVYRTTIRHTRRTPFKRTFETSSYTWLVDLDALPDHGPLGRFEARDHLGDPSRTIRANVEAFLAANGVKLDRGRILMAANARAFGYCFNPISVFWCLDDAGRQVATVVEVHNTYGDRHAYLVHPDERGRASVSKAMYVSPFHGTDGTYDLAVPLPGDRLHVAVTLRSDDGAVFSASLTGTRTARAASRRQALRAAPAAIRGSVLIRAHGLALWARRLPVRPRPQHHQEGVKGPSPPPAAPPISGRTTGPASTWFRPDRVPRSPPASPAVSSTPP